MFERFSAQARTAVVYAQEEARELAATKIRVEHLLLGVLGHPDQPLAAVLETREVTHDGVLEALTADDIDAAGDGDAEALRSIGIDLNAVRRTVDENFGPETFDSARPPGPRGRFGLGRRNFGHIPFDRAAKQALELSLKEAVLRADRVLTSSHLLLGILRTGDGTVIRALGGADQVQTLRMDLYAMLDDAAA